MDRASDVGKATRPNCGIDRKSNFHGIKAALFHCATAVN